MNVKAYRLKPWTEVIRPHEDIVGGKLEMAAYAADLGAVDRNDPNIPRVYREPAEFFRTTYPTRSLRLLLIDILRVISGGSGDRVIQLRTPFGGGKTHALLALYHLMKSRAKIDKVHLEGLPDPGPGYVAVLSGLDLDPHTPRLVDGLRIQTLWGELAFRLGGQAAFEKVRVHDETGSAPGGNALRAVIGSRPVLILLDEVLVYVQRAGGRKGDDPLRRQVMVFLQALTEVVRNLPSAAMVYSLQASVHEAAGDEALLQELDHLVTRVDAKREPVSDDEVMRVVQRRLFPAFGEDPSHAEVAGQVAREYAIAYRRLREAVAESDSDRRSAGQESERFERRVAESYPFHPVLLDVMYHRWGSLPSYQRTRGALQFLATTVHAVLNGARPPQPLIGLADVALEDEQVRGAFFSQVGEREAYSSVLAADVTGGGARSREVDQRIASDSPRYAALKVGTRCATAVMLYSFGARQGEERGVLEGELLEALVSPELDRNVLTTCLHDLRQELLYLHYTGRRYRFEPKANLNLLIAEETKKWSSDEVLDRVKEELIKLLAPASDRVVLWPPDSAAIPDGDPVFRIVYLGPLWTEWSEAEISERAAEIVQMRGPARREFRNALALAIPGRPALDRARAAARTALGISSLLALVKVKRVQVEPDQAEELRTRQSGAMAELTGAADRLYERILIPIPDRDGGQPFALDAIDLRAQVAAGRDLQGRIMDGLRKQVFDVLTPGRLVTLTKLGNERSYIATDDLVKWFFSYFDFPKLVDERALRNAVARGATDVLGYVAAARLEGETVVPSRPELVRFGAPIQEDEVDLGPGCYVLSPELALQLRGEGVPASERHIADAQPTAAVPSVESESGKTARKGYRLRLEANAAQLFRIFPALQNLADHASQFTARLEVEAKSEKPFDKTWLRNAVEEHLDEANVTAETEIF